MKTPHNFNVGKYRLHVDWAKDAQGNPTTDLWCWKWNGHYWQLLFPIEQSEFDEKDLIHCAAAHLTN